MLFECLPTVVTLVWFCHSLPLRHSHYGILMSVSMLLLAVVAMGTKLCCTNILLAMHKYQSFSSLLIMKCNNIRSKEDELYVKIRDER